MAFDYKQRKKDEKAADIVSKFMELHFYNNVENYEKIDDKELQLKGVDVVFDFQGKHYICDEKAAIQYVNKNLQTFAFELSFLGKGDKLIDGWLLSDTKINNSFLCIWIDKADYKDIEDLDDIKVLEFALIDKIKIISYLESLGWAKRKIEIKGKRVRENKDESLGDVNVNGCRFFCSRYLPEQPVNVLISRKKLKELSDYNNKIEI